MQLANWSLTPNNIVLGLTTVNSIALVIDTTITDGILNHCLYILYCLLDGQMSLFAKVK